jgi:Thiamine pyrophosphate-requiring enzymes [acetolactate synthase, pyruvate dehydrogenase (cytochrome), glyoxylate carboligase, phosphonopyruvate decarboxylase]
MAGKARTSEYDRNELQDFNQIPVVSDMCKHVRSVLDGNRIPEYIGRAINIAVNDTPGPVYIDIPREKMECGDYESDNIEFQENYVCKVRPGGSPEAIAKAADLINKANCPIIIAGSGAFFSGAAEVLTKFVEKTGIPIFTRNAGRGIVPDYHPLAMGIGASQHPVCAGAIQNADLIIMLGTRTGYTLNRKVFPKGTNIVRVDISAAALTDQLDVSAGIVGDVKTVLEQLLPVVEQKKHDEWVGMIKESLAGIAAFTAESMASNQKPIHPLRLVAEIAKRVDKDTIVVIDGGDTASWGNTVIPAMGPGQLLTIANGSFGPLGVGMPYAIAAKLAHPEKKVILLTGDGAFGYGAMEYDTCMRYGIKVDTIILNDACWGMIKNSEAKKSTTPDKPFVGLYLRETHYEEVVKGLGAYGELVTDACDIGPAIDRAMAQELPSVVNVMTDVKIAYAF